ncbi:MAG TPA: hypothetical protein P5318_11915 [Candidatus Hydrogenedentes bacterium]|nr:hypothetical protein [Candidatus Hydrogenedentota bacterium]HRT20823.1 hypothetical protein [Candidatus Hydrogenedentota bacterium]HRT66096.1 hypothetical protein [Candidatus Hydrogenedentota bacterium]
MVKKMISGIEQRGAGYWPLVTARDINTPLPPGIGVTDTVPATGLLKRTPEETFRAGFGQGSVSVPGAVKRTIDKNIQGARRLSAWEAAQAKKAANRQARINPTGKEGLGMIVAMNRSASVAEARLAGEKPASGPVTATLTVNDQTISYLATARQISNAESTATRLDVQV